MGIGETVKRLRERRAYSQEDLGKIAGISANTIWRIEAEGRVPRPSTLRKLATALKVDIEQLTAPEATNGKAGGDGPQ